MTVSVIIPALNEAGSIGQVLEAVPAGLADEVVVVDGGSSDNTAEVACAHGASVVIERGYGRACARGVAAARGEIVVFLDGDGADDPGCLP